MAQCILKNRGDVSSEMPSPFVRKTYDLYMGRDYLTASSIGDYVIFAGGDSGGGSAVAAVDVFKLEEDGSFTSSTSILRNKRAELASATMNTEVAQHIAVAGGNNSRDIDLFKIDSSGVLVRTTIGGGGGLSIGRSGLVGVSVGKYLLFAGGITNDITYQSIIDIYANSSSEHYTWKSAQLSEARYGLAAASVGNYALFGGGVASGVQSDRVDILRCENDKFTRDSDNLSVARTGLAATTIGNYVLFGGGSNSSGVYDTIDIFKLTDSGNIEKVTDIKLQLSEARRGLAATSVGNYAMFAGGYNSDKREYSTKIDIFKLEEDNTFTHLEHNLSEGRDRLAATSIGNRAMFGGGGNANGKSRVVDVFTLLGDTLIDVPGMREDMVGVVEPELSSDVLNAKEELKEWKKVNRIDTLNDAIKVTCLGEPPSKALKIKIKV